MKAPLPLFLYHAILLSKREAESTSRSPSPSKSAAWTDHAPSAEVLMAVCTVKPPLPSFLYHAILSSSREADNTSKSPSPSKSAAYTDQAPSAVVLMGAWVSKLWACVKPLSFRVASVPGQTGAMGAMARDCRSGRGFTVTCAVASVKPLLRTPASEPVTLRRV